MSKINDDREPTLATILGMNDAEARLYLEGVRWPDGVVCPFCNGREATALHGKAHRAGLYKCKTPVCRKQFTVTVGTIFHRSKVRLALWIGAFRIVCSSKKGVSALQLQRMLNLGSYQTAWHMAHRIRHAMAHEPMRALLRGRVEVDETYVGGKPRPAGRPGIRLGIRTKVPVVALVERGGNLQARYVLAASSPVLRKAIQDLVHPTARLNTDEAIIYKRTGRKWPGGHDYVRHTREYVDPKNPANHINTAESYFALLKRGVHGAFHHVSKAHLQRYVDEFQFRWNHRDLTDGQRMREALQQSDGVRLTYDAVTA